MNNFVVKTNGLIDREASLTAFGAELDRLMSAESDIVEKVGVVIMDLLTKTNDYVNRKLIEAEVLKNLNVSNDETASVVRAISQYLTSHSSNTDSTVPLRVSKGRGRGYVLWATYATMNATKASQA
jgi:hypothetical protein